MALLSLPSVCHAQTWNGSAVDGLWANPNNWTGGVPNLPTALVSFPASGNYTLPIDLGPSIFGNQVNATTLTFGNVQTNITLFNSIAGGQLRLFGTSNALVVDGGSGRTHTIHNDIQFMSGSALVNGTATSAALVLNGTLRRGNAGVGAINFTGRNNTLPAAITVNGLIRDGLLGEVTRINGGYTVDGANHRAIVRLTNDANEFGGWVWVKTNTIQFTSVANVGVPSSLGTGAAGGDDSILWLGDSTFTGTLDYRGTLATGHSTNRNVLLYGTSGGGAILANGAGPLVLNGGIAGVQSTTLNKTLTLGGDSTANNLVNGVIGPSPGTGEVSLVKSGTSTWTLTAANTLEGNVSVNQGRLRLLGAGAAIGTSTSGFRAANVSSGATLELDGARIYPTDLNIASGGAIDFKAGTIVARTNTTTTGVNAPLVIGTAGVGSLVLSGGSQNFQDVTLHGADDSLTISGGGTYTFNNLDNSVGGTMTLSAANIQMNLGRMTQFVAAGETSSIASGIQGNGGLTKLGPGTLQLNGPINHTYTGPTLIQDGTLRIVGANARLDNTTPVFIAAGAVLDISATTNGDVVGPLSGNGTVVTGLNAPFGANSNGIATTFGGRITGGGAFTKSGNARLTLTGTSDFTGSFSLTNLANLTEITSSGSIIGPADVRIGNATLLVNAGQLETPGRILFTNAPGVLRIQNGGTVKANQIDRSTIPGAVDWQNGTLHLTSNTKIAASYAADTPFIGTLTIGEPRTFVIDGVLDVNAGGTLRLAGGSVTANTVNTSGTGVIDFVAGSLRLRNNQEFTAARIAQLDLVRPIDSNRSLTIDGNLSLSSTLVLNGGSLNAGNVDGFNHLVMNGGSLQITNGNIATNASVPQINAINTEITVAGSLMNERTLNLIGVDASFAAASMNDVDGEVNATHGTLHFAGGLTNLGTLNLINSTVGGPLDNQSTVNMSGLANFTGSVQGTGNYMGGTAVFAGSLSPGAGPANLAFGGDVELTDTNTLVIELSGLLPGSQFDRLTIDGTALVDGAMSVSLLGGYSPTLGASFEIISADAGVTGAFASLNLPVLGGGLAWNVAYGANDVVLSVQSGGTLPGDFDGNGLYECADVNALVGVIAAGTNIPSFDLTGDELVNVADLDQWRSVAGSANIGPGRTYLEGDANLDGVVDGSDFGIWNSNKFTTVAEWCRGDFTADGLVDGSDFNRWNSNKFTAADSLGSVPEPSCGLLLLAVLLSSSYALRLRTVFPGSRYV